MKKPVIPQPAPLASTRPLLTCSPIIAALAFAIALVGAIVGSIRYRDQLQNVDWALVTMAGMLAVGGFMLYRWQNSEGNDFNALDLITTNGRADPYKSIIMFFAGVSAWAIVKTVLAGAPVETMLLGVLGIFVTKVAVDGLAQAWQARGAPTDNSTNVNVANIAKPGV